MSLVHMSSRRIAFALSKPHIYQLNGVWQVKHASFGIIEKFQYWNHEAVRFRHYLNKKIYRDENHEHA